jgi:flagellar biosynthetic protein FliQ
MDAVSVAIDLGRESLIVAAKVGFPLLFVGMIVGIIVSIFQTATQIQEQTLTILPKIAAVVATIYILMPWLLQVLMEYTENLFTTMGRLFE